MQLQQTCAKLRRRGVFAIVEIVAQIAHGIDCTQQRMRLEILGGQLAPFFIGEAGSHRVAFGQAVARVRCTTGSDAGRTLISMS